MNIALLGYGTVGRGVDDIIRSRVPDVSVVRILELPDRLTDPRMTSNYDQIVSDQNIELVVECMGGIEPAHTFIAQALSAGKHVVTSNKAVVAAHFAEFAQLATANDVAFLIEAAVAGGIPWIASIEKVRRIDEVRSFSGIMNGTTNYIIDSMRREELDFDVALGRAQELGYAERDPSADIDGIDVANKTILSACVAFDVDCVRDLPVTGIRTLTKTDLNQFASHGLMVKLFGRGVCKDGSYAVAVEPVAITQYSLEAAVPSNFNLVSLEGFTVGPLKFYGQGAGSLPTGNAIVQDVIDVMRGRRQVYDFSRGLTYDPTLLTSDYVFRSSTMPVAADAWAPGMWLVRNRTATQARSLFERLQQEDPTAFMAALPKEG
ncbi:MAG: homoserine dehydrogenase [Coriobacteriales bacterium]|nr:homoserine dehydrogenase [Coriobacteriales bacterium]